MALSIRKSQGELFSVMDVGHPHYVRVTESSQETTKQVKQVLLLLIHLLCVCLVLVVFRITFLHAKAGFSDERDAVTTFVEAARLLGCERAGAL